MIKRYPPINPKFPNFMHGGDYNPDQWLHMPEVLDEDMRLMKLAGCNTMSVGIFSWIALEPEEGVFNFEWLDRTMDMLAKNGAYAVLATPSGSKPAWMSRKYAEVRRVDDRRVRMLHGLRHNHCYTSPVYREKTVLINRKLAERYARHPALLVWHVSNEYGGDCHCDLCQNAFRTWLRQRYNDSLDELNIAWWTAFWGHTYTEWTQIESPSPIGEPVRHGLNLDWRRFVSDQTIDFFNTEIAPLKELTPDVPVTTNFMGVYPGLDYWKFARHVDVVAWDSYPQYHDRDQDWREAAHVSFIHDLNRSLKQGMPFMQMECSPGVQNWKPVNKLKRPGLHRVECLQSVAHGADTIQYFQWRKDRGGAEKFHGAVVDHCGHENNRIFRDVQEVGTVLARLGKVIGTTVQSETAVLYDWENRWIIDDIHGPRSQKKDYPQTCIDHYIPFWSRGVPVDIVNEDSDFSRYRLLIAPMLYMLRPGVAESIEKFVVSGGTFVTTYLTGIANESDLCFLGGWPGPLRKVLGVWAEEIDALYDGEKVPVLAGSGNGAGLSGTYDAEIFCDLIHAESAQVLASYGSEFYAGMPAVTVNSLGKGKAYYIASRNDDRFHADFFGSQITKLNLRRAIDTELPHGVTAQVRSDGDNEYVFVLNFRREPCAISLDKHAYERIDTASRDKLDGVLKLGGYGSAVLARKNAHATR